MKKVLHLKLVNSSYINGISKGFEQNGFQVYEIDYGKLLRSLGLIVTWANIFRQCEDIKPDLIFVNCNKSGFLFPPEAKELRNYAFTILYTFDCRIENNWIEDVAPYIDLICFSDMENVELFRNKGFNSEYLQVSCDTVFYKPVSSARDYGEIIFIGNRYDNTNMDFPLAKERTEMVSFMKENFGDRFKTYGRGWEDSEILNPEQEREAYSSCKVSITHNNFYRNYYCSDRDFRSMACGAFTICRFYNGVDSDFYTWKKFTNLKRLCANALIYETTRKEKAEEIRDYVIKRHSWINRISSLSLIVNKYVKYAKI